MTACRPFPEALTRHSYWLAVLLPLLMPLAWSLRNLPGMSILFAWLPLVVLYGLLPALDLLIGRDTHNPAGVRASAYPDTVIPVAAAVTYVGVLAWSLGVIGRYPDVFQWPVLAGWILSLGDVSGIAGINVAHELIHRRNRWLQRLGGVLLSCSWYAGFKLEHPRWHHVHVATPADPSSAPVDSTIYRQVPRALLLNTLRAFRLSAREARRRGRRTWAWRHEIAGWYALSILLAAAVGLAWGPVAAVAFLLQGFVAATLLEIINFVEHYGLHRRRREGGGFEPPAVRHSWDCDFWLSNAILIQLPRHADHHTHPLRAFSGLQRHGEAPVLPLGYPLLVNIAFLPWRWRRIIHPHLPGERRESGRISG
jgi:alkane 1-monooxygenase